MDITKISIEPTNRNLNELLEIERESFVSEAYTREQILNLLNSPHAIGLVARVNGEVAGFIIGTVESAARVKTGHVFTIDVGMKHRRKGIGMQLLKELEDAFARKGATISYLEVKVENRAARQLYEKLGYFEAEPLRDYYSAGVHGLRLKKELKRNVSSET